MKYEEEQGSWKQKEEQLNNLLKIKDIEDRNNVTHYKVELEALSQECRHLRNKNEELKNKETKMKMEIIDKDRIIMSHINGKKVVS